MIRDKRLAIAAALLLLWRAAPHRRRPNIVLIYADDLGYGDVSPTAPRVRTPNIDRLAGRPAVHRRAFGLGDLHAVAVRDADRRVRVAQERHRGPAGRRALIIEPGRTTLPALLRTRLLDRRRRQVAPRAGRRGRLERRDQAGAARGRLRLFVHHARHGDRVPCVYVEDQRVVGLDPADPIGQLHETVGDDRPARDPELLRCRRATGTIRRS